MIDDWNIGGGRYRKVTEGVTKSVTAVFFSIYRYYLPVEYVIAPETWHFRDENPFTGGAFDQNWGGLFFLNRDDFMIYNGRGKNNLYCVGFSRNVNNICDRAVDFVRYENYHGRRVILGSDYQTDIEPMLLHGASASRTEVRASDPRYVVHSTSAESWARIIDDGELKSLARLRKEGIPVRTISNTMFGEPDEYLDYVHFSNYDSEGPEIVVLSHQIGEYCSDADTEYTPGVRIYLDNHRLISDGLMERDGLHLSKVRNGVPLVPYVVAVVDSRDIMHRKPWTPSSFCAEATKLFETRVGLT